MEQSKAESIASRLKAAWNAHDMQDLYSLIEDASLAPSSFNLQHCRFMAITTPELKSELANITLRANRQTKRSQASTAL